MREQVFAAHKNLLVLMRQVVRGSGWSLAEVESLSLEGEGIRSLRGSLGGLRRLVYLNLARNNISSLLVSVGRQRVADTDTHRRPRLARDTPHAAAPAAAPAPPARGGWRSYGRAGDDSGELRASARAKAKPPAP